MYESLYKKPLSLFFFFLASLKFNPHTKTEIPGVEKVSLSIKVNNKIKLSFELMFCSYPTSNTASHDDHEKNYLRIPICMGFL